MEISANVHCSGHYRRRDDGVYPSYNRIVISICPMIGSSENDSGSDTYTILN
jgi:hypothetical protein